MILLLAAALFSAAAPADYCSRNPANNLISCKYVDTHGKPYNATITISLTREGYSLMIAIFVDEWLMLGGEASAQFGDSEPVPIEYKGTRRDITEEELLMEAAVYLVDKEFLQKMHTSDGTIVFRLATEEEGEIEVKFWARRFKHLDDYIEETQAVLNPK